MSWNSNNKTHEVGKKKPNALGLYDMSGNVLEWCDNFYSSSSPYRVCRGGRYCDSADYCEVSYRVRNYEFYRDLNIGFRLLRPLN